MRWRMRGSEGPLRVWQPEIWIVAGVMALPLVAAAQPRDPHGNRPATRETTADPKAPRDTPPEFPSIKDVLTNQIAALDKDLAARIMRRSDAPAPALELQIDLRIIRRWMLAQAAAA